jgi:predicted aspartyl protease
MARCLTLVVGVLIGQWLAFSGLTSPADLHALGVAAYQRNDFAEAARVWSRAVAAQPDNALFHYLRGTALARLGQRTSAVDAYQLTLLLEPPERIARLAQEALLDLGTAKVQGDGGETAVALEPMRGVWVVGVVLNGLHQARFLVDSGSSVTLVSPALAAALGIREARGRHGVELQTLAGRTAGSSSTLASLRVGSAEMRDAPVVVHEPGPGLDGILGNNFLGRYLVTLDAARGVLHLKLQTRK